MSPRKLVSYAFTVSRCRTEQILDSLAHHEITDDEAEALLLDVAEGRS